MRKDENGEITTILRYLLMKNLNLEAELKQVWEEKELYTGFLQNRIPIEVRIYDRLFTRTTRYEKRKRNFDLNKEFYKRSSKVLTSLKNAKVGDHYQFKIGYFTPDKILQQPINLQQNSYTTKIGFKIKLKNFKVRHF